MNILISNDDGIRAEGIARLAAAALPFGRVYVAAPQSQCSGMSQKLTIFGEMPLHWLCGAATQTSPNCAAARARRAMPSA